MPPAHPHPTVYRSPVFTHPQSHPYHPHPQPSASYATSNSYRTVYPHPHPHHPHEQYYDERPGYGRRVRGDVVEPDDELMDEHDGSDPEVGGGGASEKRRHACLRCGKRFNRPSSLKIHLNTHTGAKREFLSVLGYLPIVSILYVPPYPRIAFSEPHVSDLMITLLSFYALLIA